MTTPFAAFANLARTRRTIGNFKPEDVDSALVERAIEVACWAPNHKKTEPWRFTCIGPQARQAIVDLNARLTAESKGAEAGEVKRRQWSTIPGWIAVTSTLASDDFTREEDYAACACAVQNLMLALWTEGVGTKWATGDVTRHPDYFRLLQIDPTRERSIGLIWYGYPQSVPQSSRQPVSAVLRRLD